MIHVSWSMLTNQAELLIFWAVSYQVTDIQQNRIRIWNRVFHVEGTDPPTLLIGTPVIIHLLAGFFEDLALPSLPSPSNTGSNHKYVVMEKDASYGVGLPQEGKWEHDRGRTCPERLTTRPRCFRYSALKDSVRRSIATTCGGGDLEMPFRSRPGFEEKTLCESVLLVIDLCFNPLNNKSVIGPGYARDPLPGNCNQYHCYSGHLYLVAYISHIPQTRAL